MSGPLTARPGAGRAQGRRRWGAAFARVVLSALLCVSPARAAEQVQIHDVRTLLVEGVYRLGARVEFHFNDTIRDALQNGVPLVLQMQIEVVHERDWLWPETIAQLKKRFLLKYHALSQRYLVRDYSTGVLRSFRFLGQALDSIGSLYDLPLLDANLLKPEGRYNVRMRAGLDIESLPTPIRLMAYVGSDWRIASDWYQWPLQP